MQGNDRVTLCFFGDGASNEGTFHESLNLAAVWQLPVVYLCENNGYGELSAGTPRWCRCRTSRTGPPATACPAITVDGQDVVAVYEAVSEAVGAGPRRAAARRWSRPRPTASTTTPSGCRRRAYRDQAEVDEWRKRDPVELFRARLLAEGVLDDAAVKAHRGRRCRGDRGGHGVRRVQPISRAPDAAFDHVFTNPIPIRR